MPDLNIIYEDNDIIVINKESGVVVNTSNTSPENTIQSFLTDKIDIVEGDEETDFDLRSGIVHRLDKDTSGVLLAAKNKEAFSNLQKQFKSRQVSKEYLALIIGKLPDDVIEIDAPIARHPHVRVKFAVVSDGKEAKTKAEKVKEIVYDHDVLTLVRIFPQTGRTHQIRVHMAALGTPVVGDAIYASKKQLDRWGRVFPRLMLHACKIEILHPTKQTKMTFEAPLPNEFLAIM